MIDNSTFKVGLYIRLSREDENNSEYEYAFKDVRTLWIEPINFENVVGNFVELSLNNTPIFVPFSSIT